MKQRSISRYLDEDGVHFLIRKMTDAMFESQSIMYEVLLQEEMF